MITFHISALIGRENLENGVSADLGEMTNKLQLYLDKGRVASASEAREEPLTRIRPDSSMIKPLSKMKESNGNFLAVDCATRTLKRANNWGIYLMRAAYAAIKGRDVNWNYLERLCTTVGDAYTRSNVLTDVRIELESQMALELLTKENDLFYYEGTVPRSNYLLLDGKGIKPQRGLKDHPLFPSRIQFYSAREGKMTIGLHTLTPEKLSTLFPDIGLPQFRLARKLHKTLGNIWIENAREAYAAEGPAGVGQLAQYKTKPWWMHFF